MFFFLIFNCLSAAFYQQSRDFERPKYFHNVFHFLFDIISIIVPDPNLTNLKAIIYVKKDHF